MLALLITTSLVYLLGKSETQKQVVSQLKLPIYLREASGLTEINDNEILTHNDETGVIYKINLSTHLISKLATLGNPAIKADFEGITLSGTDVFMVTSKGILYRLKVSLSEPNQQVIPEIIDTGLSAVCEIEGLAFDNDKLLLPCKTAYTKENKKRLVVFAFDIRNRITTTLLSIPEDNLGKIKKRHPTAIDTDDDSYYLIAGLNLLVISKTDFSTKVFKLSKKNHSQPEGLAVLSNGQLVVVDDIKRGASRVTTYSGLEQLKATSQKK